MELNMRLKLSGVVMRISGGYRCILRRSVWGVSPLRGKDFGKGERLLYLVKNTPEFLEWFDQVSLDIVI